jgi:hypothetical protein
VPSKAFFISSSVLHETHSGVKKWQLISVSYFSTTYTRNGNDSHTKKKELIILIKSIFNMETKKNLRTSNEKPPHKTKLQRKSQKETSFWLRNVFLSYFFPSPSWKFFGVVLLLCVLHLSFSFKSFKNKYFFKPWLKLSSAQAKPEFIILNENMFNEN